MLKKKIKRKDAKTQRRFCLLIDTIPDSKTKKFNITLQRCIGYLTSLRLCVFAFNFSLLCLSLSFCIGATALNAQSWLGFESDEICGDPAKNCWGRNLQVTLPNGSKVSCAIGYFDAEDQKITLFASQGGAATFEGNLSTGEPYKIEAVRYTLTRQEGGIFVVADAPIFVDGGTWGQIRCDGKMYAYLSSEGKLRKILLEGTTTLTSNCEGKKFCRIPGKLSLNLDKGMIIGSALKEQIYFEGEVGGLYDHWQRS